VFVRSVIVISGVEREEKKIYQRATKGDTTFVAVSLAYRGGGKKRKE
jgi:hypothetical protein